MQLKISPILMKTEIEYKAPLTIYDQPIGRCWMAGMGKSKWEMELEIIAGPKTYCTGKQSGCFYHLEKRKPAPIPQRLVDLYNQEVGG